MASDFSSSGKRINDLRVVDLRSELEKRGLEKTGVKQALIERLKKALINEGFDADQHDFDTGSTASQRSATRQTTGEMLQDPNVTAVESDTSEMEQKHSISESRPIDEEAESDLIAVAGDNVVDVEGQQLDTSVEPEEMCDEIAEQEIEGEFEEANSEDQIEDQAEDNNSAWHGDGGDAEEVAGVCDDTDAVTLHQATIEPDDAAYDDDMGHCDDFERPDQAIDSGDDSFLRDEEATGAVPSSSVQTSSQIVAERGPSDIVAKMLPAERKPEDDLFVLVDDDLDNDIINMHATGLSRVEPFTKSTNNEKSPATVAVSTPILHSSELAGDKLVPKSGTAVLEQTATMEDKTGTSNATTNAPVPSGGTCDGLKEEVVDADPAKNSEKPTVKSLPKEEPASVPDAKASTTCSSTASRNLWISGLSSTTRAADLKILFSKHGKVAGAKIVTNAKSPGAKCYGFVTMATTEEASKCIQHLHRTELHGRMISVERAKADPSSHVHLTEKKLAPVKPTDSATRASLAAKRLGSGSKIMNAMPSSASVPASSSSTAVAVAATTETPKTLTSPASSTKAAALSGSADQAEHTPMEVDPSDIKEAAKKSVEKKESVKRDKEKTPSERHSKGNANDGHRFSGKDHPRQPRRYVGSGFRGSRGAPYRPRFTAKPLARGMREHEAAIARRRQERPKVHDMQERRRVIELQRERMRQRMIERAQQDEAIRLERERERLRIEKQRLELERLEAERERILLERERQRRERERIEQEREEERRLEMIRRREQMQQVQQQHHQHQQGRSVKRAHDSGTYWHTPESKRMATSPETRRFAAANARVVPPPGRFDDRRHDDRPAQSTRKASVRSPERRPGTAVASASSVKSAVARSTHSERERLIMTEQVKTSSQHRSSAGGRAEWKPAPGGDRSKGARRDEKVTGYVPVQPSSSSMPSAHDRNGSSSGWRTSSGHGSTAAKGRDYSAVSSSSNQWIPGRNMSSVQPQVTGTRSDWSNRGPGGSISAAAGATTGSTSRGAWPARGGTSSSSGTGTGTGTGHSFLSSATNILMGMGVTSSRSAAAPDTRFDAYKSVSSNSTSNRRY